MFYEPLIFLFENGYEFRNTLYYFMIYFNVYCLGWVGEDDEAECEAKRQHDLGLHRKQGN